MTLTCQQFTENTPKKCFSDVVITIQVGVNPDLGVQDREKLTMLQRAQFKDEDTSFRKFWLQFCVKLIELLLLQILQ